MEDNFSTDWGRGGGGRNGMGPAVMRAMGAADAASLARPPLTFCSAALFLAGCGPLDYGMVSAVQTTKLRSPGRKLLLKLTYVIQINTNNSKSLGLFQRSINI